MCVFFLSHYFLIFHILLYDWFFLLNNNVFLVIFHIIFWGAFKEGSITCFIHVIVYFLLISEHFATIISSEPSMLFLDMIFQSIYYCTCLITCHTNRYSFLLGFQQRWFPKHHHHNLCHNVLLNVLCHCVAHQHLPWAHYSLQWPFHKSLLYCQLLIFTYFLIISLFSTSFFYD